MPRCNQNRCAFLGNSCMGSPSDAYCADRITPVKAQKKMKELNINNFMELKMKLREERKGK